MNEKYRPSNGTEGHSFMARFCEQCRRNTPEKPCEVLGRMLAFDLDHPDYPVELIRDAAGRSTCTAFSYDDGTDQPAPYRCPDTKDLFS